MRNPYKAIQSWHRHLHNGVHSDTDFDDQAQQGINKFVCRHCILFTTRAFQTHFC